MEDSGVLIVDDDLNLLELAVQYFAIEGMKVHCAASGEEALVKLRKRSFGLMLTDLNMPGLNGFELAKMARDLAPGMPVVMGTGDGISPDISRLAREAGIVKVFSKPLHLAGVLRMIKERTREHI